MSKHCPVRKPVMAKAPMLQCQKDQHSTGSTSHFEVSSSFREDESAVARTSVSSDSKQPILLQTTDSSDRRTTVNRTTIPPNGSQKPRHRNDAERARDIALSLQGITLILLPISLGAPSAFETEVSDAVDLLFTHSRSLRIPAEIQRDSGVPSVITHSDEGSSPLERYIHESHEERYSLFSVQPYDTIHSSNSSSTSSTQHEEQEGPWRFRRSEIYHGLAGAEKLDLTRRSCISLV